jgi:sensor histidine kinase regulating citrate/malate metabolism
MATSVVVLVVVFAVLNVAFLTWSHWMQTRRMKQMHYRLDIHSHDLGRVQAEQQEIEARVSVGEQERRWQEEIRKVSEKY